ncbi:MAG: HAD family hydrolase [Chitinophagaceae bacterium]|nr:HAD family hydrolase [Chitinophagaceae bacterium]MBN8667747.1 HAD family hydrolase [Chitinophagales bacterium]
MTKTIAFFDFDGTITTHDTMLELIRFSKGPFQYYKGMCWLSPLLTAVKTGLVDAQTGKERLLGHFFGGLSSSDFQELCHSFGEKKIPGLIRPAALTRLQEHQDKGHEVVIVSASAFQWVNPWTEKMGIRLISSLLSEEGQRITGKLEGKNCNGDQKVVRIKEQFNLDEYKEIFAYGDSKGDRPMLQLATHPSYKPFRS